MKISPMMKWTSSVARKDKEDGYADERNEIEREEEHKFEDLSEGEWRVYATMEVVFDQSCEAFIDEDCIEDIHQSFIDKESFEE